MQTWESLDLCPALGNADHKAQNKVQNSWEQTIFSCED